MPAKILGPPNDGSEEISRTKGARENFSFFPSSATLFMHQKRFFFFPVWTRIGRQEEEKRLLFSFSLIKPQLEMDDAFLEIRKKERKEEEDLRRIFKLQRSREEVEYLQVLPVPRERQNLEHQFVKLIDFPFHPLEMQLFLPPFFTAGTSCSSFFFPPLPPPVDGGNVVKSQN